MGKTKSLKIFEIYKRDICTRSETGLKEPISSRDLVRVYDWNLKSAGNGCPWEEDRELDGSPAVPPGVLLRYIPPSFNSFFEIFYAS